MRRTSIAAAALLVASIAQGADLEVSQCAFPDAPTVPDGSSAAESEMGEAGAAVREYVTGVQSSLECLSAAEESMGEEITEEQQAQLVALYNAGVDQMNSVVENYNEQVRSYKSK